jgi:hypothetical protein
VPLRAYSSALTLYNTGQADRVGALNLDCKAHTPLVWYKVKVSAVPTQHCNTVCCRHWALHTLQPTGLLVRQQTVPTGFRNFLWNMHTDNTTEIVQWLAAHHQRTVRVTGVNNRPGRTVPTATVRPASNMCQHMLQGLLPIPLTAAKTHHAY